MAWGKGDNSKANTISDREWRKLQDRARKSNHTTDKGAKRGRDNLRQAQRGNN
jgi:hypothetical protein